MPSSSAVPSSTLAATQVPRRRLLISGHIYPRRLQVAPPIPATKTCVWCGQAISDADPAEQIGLAYLHQFSCVEQFHCMAYGDEGNR